MAVQLIIPGVLRSEVDGATRLSVPVAGTLGDVLDEVGRRWPRLERRIRDERGRVRRYVNVYVDGADCRERPDERSMPVPDGADIQILPSVAGG